MRETSVHMLGIWLVGAIMLTIGGSVISFKDWETMSQIERQAMIRTNPTFSERQKELLMVLLRSNSEMEGVPSAFRQRASELRKDADLEKDAEIRTQYLETARLYDKEAEQVELIVAQAKELEGVELNWDAQQKRIEILSELPESKQILQDIEAGKKTSKGLRESVGATMEAMKETMTISFLLEQNTQNLKSMKRSASWVGPIMQGVGYITLILGLFKVMLEIWKMRKKPVQA